MDFLLCKTDIFRAKNSARDLCRGGNCSSLGIRSSLALLNKQTNWELCSLAIKLRQLYNYSEFWQNLQIWICMSHPDMEKALITWNTWNTESKTLRQSYFTCLQPFLEVANPFYSLICVTSQSPVINFRFHQLPKSNSNEWKRSNEKKYLKPRAAFFASEKPVWIWLLVKWKCWTLATKGFPWHRLSRFHQFLQKLNQFFHWQTASSSDKKNIINRCELVIFVFAHK